jgi:hypothetical protein
MLVEVVEAQVVQEALFNKVVAASVSSPISMHNQEQQTPEVAVAVVGTIKVALVVQVDLELLS